MDSVEIIGPLPAVFQIVETTSEGLWAYWQWLAAVWWDPGRWFNAWDSVEHWAAPPPQAVDHCH